MKKIFVLVSLLLTILPTANAAPDIAKIVAAIMERATLGALIPARLARQSSLFTQFVRPNLQHHLGGYVYVGENLRGHRLLVSAAPMEPVLRSTSLRAGDGALTHISNQVGKNGEITLLVGGKTEAEVTFFTRNLRSLNVDARAEMASVLEREFAEAGLGRGLSREGDTIFLPGANGDRFVFSPFILHGNAADASLLERILQRYSSVAR